MMGKIIPILLALIGLGAGVGAGIALKPAQEVAKAGPCGDGGADAQAHEGDPAGDDHAGNGHSDFVKMNNQFVIPVVSEGTVGALVVLSLSIEITAGESEAFYQREPKLRDAFLQVLFDHANTGGFGGVFTDGGKLASLRRALREVAKKTIGPTIIDVLVTDIVRQDV